MIAEWDKKFPGRSWNVFAALSSVVPTHLMDRRLFDFAGLKLTGAATEDGDMAFDTEDFNDPALPPEDDEATPKHKVMYMTDLRETD